MFGLKNLEFEKLEKPKKDTFLNDFLPKINFCIFAISAVAAKYSLITARNRMVADRPAAEGRTSS